MFRSPMPVWKLLPALAALSGCYDEGLPIFDLQGILHVPKEVVTRTVTPRTYKHDSEGNVLIDPASGMPLYDGDGKSQEITDIKFLGPVYVGLYAGISDNAQSYPYPIQGPQVGDGTIADAYPYGGTTVGDMKYACYAFFSCKITDGRYTSFDELVDWWNLTLGQQIVDEEKVPVTSGEQMLQTCLNLREWTATWEIGITDRYIGSKRVTGEDALDFKVDENGDFVAHYTIPQAEFFQGMSVYAFVDNALDSNGFVFDTCSDSLGYQETTYNRNWYAGAQQRDTLNTPLKYLQLGDYVSEGGEAAVWDDPYAVHETTVDFPVPAQ